LGEDLLSCEGEFVFAPVIAKFLVVVKAIVNSSNIRTLFIF